MKITISEIKNILGRTNRRLNNRAQNITELEDIAIENIHNEVEREKYLKVIKHQRTMRQSQGTKYTNN